MLSANATRPATLFSTSPLQAVCRFAPSSRWLLTVSFLVLVLGQLLFKLKLEAGHVLSNVHVPDHYFKQPWKLLLPATIDGGHVRWSTTGLVITTWLDQAMSAETTIYLLATLLAAVSFVTSWLAFRSFVFTTTFTICMAFGTQFNYAWVNGSCSVYYLLVAYAEVNLLCLHRLLTQPDSYPRATRVTFVASLILFALCWETWLDYAIFLVLLCVVGGLFIWRHRRWDLSRRCRFVGCTALGIAVPYLLVRVAYGGSHNVAGSESELLLNHNHAALMIEDLYSNVLTYLYIALTAFLPPWFLSSNAQVDLGEEELLRAQNGYHAAYGAFVPMHYHYLWYFQAGMAALAFAYLTFRLVRRCVRRPSAECMCLAVLCLLVWCGFSTHALIKFRPYLSAPVLSYKVTVSILGVAVLLSVAVMKVVRQVRRPVGAGILLLLVWGVLLLGTFTRPHWQATLLSKVGCSGPPDPLLKLE
jgi:hypothetical protein